MSNVLKLLSQAVKERRNAVIRYNGQHQIRVVEPHVIYTDRDDTILVECFQASGYTDPGEELPFWKTFQWRKINSVYILNTTFTVRMAESFQPNKEEYLRGLVTIVGTSEQRSRDKGSSWWDEVGSSIDNFLANQDFQGKV